MKKKILIIGYNPPPYHGVVRMTALIKNFQLLNKQFDVDIFNLKTISNSEKRGSFCGMNILYNIYNIVTFMIKCSFNKYSILYLSLAQSNLGFLRDSIFVLLAKQLKVKVCAHFHAGDFDKSYARKNILYRQYMKFVLRKLDRLIVVGEKIKKQFVNFVDPNKISVLSNFIDKDFIPEYILREDKEEINILFIGYISKAKGAFDLVRAAKVVLDNVENKTINFLLCGDFIDIERNVTYIKSPNWGARKVQDFIEKNGLNNRVRLLGYVNDSLKEELLKKSDIFVLPSYSESMTLVVLEAMSYSLPLVLTRVGVLDEVCVDHKNCLFAELANPGDLSAKIIHLIQDNDSRINMGRNNYELVKEGYTNTVHEKYFVDILESIYNESEQMKEGDRI